MGKNIVYSSKRGTWAPHCESNLVFFLNHFFRLLFLSLKFIFFIIKIPLANKGIDNKKIIKE